MSIDSTPAKPNSKAPTETSNALTRRHQPAPPARKLRLRSRPAKQPAMPVATANAAPAAVDGPAPTVADERRDANDLARAAIERLRVNTDSQSRPQEAPRVSDAPRVCRCLCRRSSRCRPPFWSRRRAPTRSIPCRPRRSLLISRSIVPRTRSVCVRLETFRPGRGRWICEPRRLARPRPTGPRPTGPRPTGQLWRTTCCPRQSRYFTRSFRSSKRSACRRRKRSASRLSRFAGDARQPAARRLHRVGAGPGRGCRTRLLSFCRRCAHRRRRARSSLGILRGDLHRLVKIGRGSRDLPMAR